MNSTRPTVCFLFDNGSLRAESTRSLRRVAAALGAKTGREVRPASWLHSNRVPVGELEGVPAELLTGALCDLLASAPTATVDLLPLFFGRSAAVTEQLPAGLRELQALHPSARFRVAMPLVDPDDAADRRMARILADQIRATLGTTGGRRAKVLLVDHGSPTRAVTAVRDHLGVQLRAELGAEAEVVGVASMERRMGPEFAFNEPLMATALRIPPFDDGEVIVALQFLSPGRHAGPDGDIAMICRAAEAERPGLRTRMTEPIASHPLLIDVLAERLAAARTFSP